MIAKRASRTSPNHNGSSGSLKIPLRRVMADDCAIVLGRVILDGQITKPGTPYYVHQGEWVDFMPVQSVEDMVMAIRTLSIAKDGGEETPIMIADRISAWCDRLAHSVIMWNWTGLAGEPLPQPYGRPDVLMGLSNDELIWIINQAQAMETPVERKND